MALVTRTFHIDARTLSYGDLLDYLEQIPRVRKFEAGEDPDAKLDITQFIQSVMAGKLKPDAYSPKNASKRVLDPAEKAKLKKQLADLGIGTGKKKQQEVVTRMPSPKTPRLTF